MDHISPALEDYLEAILILSETCPRVRIKALAGLLKVKAPSVISALNHLKQKGLATQQPYGAVNLTPTGRRLAREIYGRHKMLKKFFHEILGLRGAVAEKEACQIEHYLSRETIRRMLSFIENHEAVQKQRGR